MIYSAGIGGEAFSSAQHSGSLGPAQLMARRVSPGDRSRLLDFPQTVETARTYVLEAGLTGPRTAGKLPTPATERIFFPFAPVRATFKIIRRHKANS
jgi:hypothetical protein